VVWAPFFNWLLPEPPLSQAASLSLRLTPARVTFGDQAERVLIKLVVYSKELFRSFHWPWANYPLSHASVSPSV
jgi:hypothetical protein